MIQKGVDLVGWRTCARQKEWGPKRFSLTLKKIGRQAAEVASSPPPTGAANTPDQRKRFQQYEEYKQSSVIFNQGTPECKECPISNGQPYSCYTFVEYPIDAEAERLLFEFFANSLDTEGSPAAGIYRDIVAKVPTSGTVWHKDRGVAGTLAELESPIVKEWGFLMWKKRVDSAQLLRALFFNQSRATLMSVFAKFWEDFIEFARTKDEFEGSKTLKQFERLAEFYDRVAGAASTAEGIHILVEDDAPSEPKP